MTTKPAGDTEMSDTLAFADVEIRIRALRQGGGYPVEITLDGEQEFGPVELSPDGLLPWGPSATSAEDGERLFGWLLGDASLRAAWSEIRGQHPSRRIRLRIDREAPELHALPWELLREPAAEGGVAVDLAAAEATPFSRYLAGQWRPGSPVFKRPLKVLLAVADPEDLEAAFDLQPIDVAAETELLRAATEGLEIELTVLAGPCTLAAIEEALKAGHHVLHYVGHGAYSEKSGSALLLAGPENQTKPVRESDFAEMLGRQLAVEREDGLRLVFLSSCQTASRSPADAFRGFAPALVAAGVPAVVAMQDLLPVETGRAFSAAFYGRLLAHGQIDLAANEARSALLSGQLPGASIPVVFMRLRTGILLGKWGRISADKDPDDFWPVVLDYIEDKRCLPFLGPGVNRGLLADREQIAARLAEKYKYPLGSARRGDLMKVAQFLALKDPELLRREYLRSLQQSLYGKLDMELTGEQKKTARKAGLARTASELGWSERVLELHENQIHHLLAAFGLPLYLTTNVDNFMALALAARDGVEVRQVGPRWQAQVGAHYVLDDEPSPERPVVFHLSGFDGDPEQEENLVLSEDEYFAQLVRLASVADQDHFLPQDVMTALSQQSFLFLGYRLDDWEFRLLLHGLLKPIHERRSKKLNVGVQLEPEHAANSEGAVNFLRSYLGRYDIDIYWGTPQQFVGELHTRWKYWDPDE